MVCLNVLSVEDIEDLYIFGLMITGFSLIGFGITMVYRKVKSLGKARACDGQYEWMTIDRDTVGQFSERLSIEVHQSGFF